MQHKIVVSTCSKCDQRHISKLDGVICPHICQRNWLRLTGTIEKEFYTEYLQKYLSINERKRVEKYIADEDYIECYVYEIDNPCNKGTLYWADLWFLDIGLENGKYYPIYVPSYNTSSPYGMYRSGVLCELNNGDECDVEKYILSLVPDFICEKSIKTILNLSSRN